MAKKLKAIIIDDEENARMYLAKMLVVSFPETEIEFAVSPAEALFVLDKKMVDLIFLDVEMPGMTGLEMLKVLREKNIETPAIFVSQFSKADFIQKAMRLSAVDYLYKPVNPDELELAVKKIIEKNEKNDNNAVADNTEKLCLPTNKGTMYIVPSEIVYFETSGRDSIIHIVNGSAGLLVKNSLIELENILPSTIFRRVSRQNIVNISYIKLVSRNKSLVLRTPHSEVKLQRIFPQIIDEFSG